MNRLISVLPVTGLAAASLFAAVALAAPNASAQACRVDSSDGSCKPEGAACTPAGGGAGRCKTTQPNVREYVCVCAKRGPAPGRSDPDRPRPRDQSPYGEPTEEQEPQEPET